MPGAIVLTDGQRFGRLVIVGMGLRCSYEGRARYRCRCDCGDETDVRASHLKQGLVTSCGCARSEAAKRMGMATRTHGHAVEETAEYKAWCGAKSRCNNPRNRNYRNYGARGICVCPEWQQSFEAFLTHIGPKPSPAHTLERKDNNRGYEPGNVRWATMQEQINNTRVNRIVEVRGERMTLAQAIRLLGLKSSTVRQRLAVGWPMERALA